MSDWHDVRPLPAPEADAWSLRLRRLAHDANNGLVAAYAHLELLRAEDLPATARARTADLEAALGRFHTMARLLSHAAARESAAEDTNAIRAELAAEAMRAGIGLRWSVNQGPSVLAAVPANVRDRVLRILVRNALEAHQGAGMRAPGNHPWVEVRLERTDATVHVVVRDNGPGCPTPAAVASGRKSRTGLGHLGIGLPMAAAAMAEVGGSLAIRANEDGFTARADFPIGPGRA